jgi:chromosome segregation ATPase
VSNVSSEPATKADLRELASKAELSAVRSDVEVLKEDVRVLKEDVRVLKEDVRVLKDDVAELKADMVEVKATMATRTDLEVWGLRLFDMMKQSIDELRVDLTRQINASTEAMRAEFRGHKEELDARVAANDERQSELRTAFEAHRDDVQVHRMARRRRR